jgi:hypothetical protein
MFCKKETFASFVLAETAMRAVLRRSDRKRGRPNVWFCCDCHGYHWGHRPTAMTMGALVHEADDDDDKD